MLRVSVCICFLCVLDIAGEFSYEFVSTVLVFLIYKPQILIKVNKVREFTAAFLISACGRSYSFIQEQLLNVMTCLLFVSISNVFLC
jgi:hypothetical protein